MYRKRRHNKNVKRLIKQISVYKYDWKEFKIIKPLRSRSYQGQIFDIGWYDYPKSYKPERNWKKFRTQQYKTRL